MSVHTAHNHGRMFQNIKDLHQDNVNYFTAFPAQQYFFRAEIRKI